MPVRGTVPGQVAPPPPADAPETFTLYQHGGLTVIGWDGAEEIDPHPADFLQEVADLAAGAGATALAVDLKNLESYPPGLLGGLPSLVRRGVRVLLFDPTPRVRAVLRASHLDELLGVHVTDDVPPEDAG